MPNKNAATSALEDAMLEASLMEYAELLAAALVAAAKGVAYRHVGVSCEDYVFSNVDSPYGLFAETTVNGPHTDQQDRVAKLTAVYAVERYDMQPGVTPLPWCEVLEESDLAHATIENEVTEALHIVESQWPVIVAEWEQIKTKAAICKPLTST